MKHVELKIRTKPGEYVVDQQIRSIQLWLASLRFNGQVLGVQHVISQQDDIFSIFLSTPEEDSLAIDNGSEYVAKCTKDMKGIGLTDPVLVKVRNDSIGEKYCLCEHNPFFIISTDCFSIASPVLCGRCFKPYPLYKLPQLDQAGFEGLINWQVGYQAFDQLYINSGVGEKFAANQLCGIRSQLTQEGLLWRDELRAKCDRNVYYYLLTIEDDTSQLCPQCKRTWEFNDGFPYKFKKMCQKCNLISNM